MSHAKSYLKISSTAFVLFLYASTLSMGQENKLPFRVKPLFNLEDTIALGLNNVTDTETFSIFIPGENDNKYNHGAVLFPFKGKLYAMWQSSSVDEDGDDTQVLYSTSNDGMTWERPVALTAIWNGGIKTSGGWWSDGSTLVAFICVWPKFHNDSKQGYTEYITSTDGVNWQSPQPVTDENGETVMGIIEQDVRALPGGRLLTAFHLQPGLIVTPFYTDHPLGTTGWKAGYMRNMPSNNEFMSREIEPGWFYRKDSAIVMIFRDQHSSYKKLASVSQDQGKTWTTPIMVDTPDSRSKQSAGNLPNGTAFMVNNPTGNRTRFPLAITLSQDGFLFDKAYLLRGGNDLQNMRFEGRYKRRGFSYPKSVIWNDFLYVSYATNKEDVELTRIPISRLAYESE